VGKTLRQMEWGRSLMAMACAGMLLGTGAIAFAESTPPHSTSLPASKLESEQALALQSGYVQAFPEPASGMVIDAREAKRLFGEGDVLYLKLAPTTDAKVGDWFTLFRPTTHMYHPITREYMGRMVSIRGILEIAKIPGDGVVEALVVRSFDAMASGDLLRPYKAPPPVPAQQVTSGTLTGIVLDFKIPRQLTGQLEIVYLDKGEMDGVALGDRFTVSHRGRRLSATSKNPDQAVAELKIISVQARTSTAVVLQSADVIRRGDIIHRLSPPAVPPRENASDAMADATTTTPPMLSRQELAAVHFAFDKWHLSDEDKKTLAEHAAYLKQNPMLAITIEGHADERGSREYNLVLGEKRARAVHAYLLAFGLANPMRITSFGKERPLCIEPDETCHAMNRRAHLTAGN